MKFTLRTMSRTRKRKETRKIRGVLELLETRKLMAGDLNMGSYVIGGGEPDIDAPSVIERVETASPVETPAPVEAAAPVETAAPDLSVPGGVDAALTGDQSWLPPDFLPCCPASKLDNATAEATLTEGDGADANINDPVKPVTTSQVFGNPGDPQGPRDRIASSLRTASEHRGTLSLASAGSQPEHSAGISDTIGLMSAGKKAADEFHYFTEEGNRRLIDAPSLAKQALSGHVQPDTFMTMSLLPSPQSSAQRDGPTSASESELQLRRQHSVRSDGRSETLDLNTLRDVALAAESDPIVAPLPFLAATTDSISDSISAAVASVVSIDYLSGGTGEHDSDASLIAKLNENRYQFAAFALYSPSLPCG